MGTNIYELCGKGATGGPAMCHVVALGAHDGRPGTRYYNVRKVTPNRSKQYRSWFDPAARNWVHDGHPIVGQIFYPFGDRSLDHMTDRRVLDALIAWYRFELAQNNRVELEFVGHTDPRGPELFNMRLGKQRAEAVRRYVDRGMKTNAVERLKFFKYKSMATSLGEAMRTGDNTADRRVDIVLKHITVNSFVEFPESKMITAEYRGPLTTKLLFRPWGGFGAGILKFGMETLEIEIKNANTGASAFYQYIGGSAGVGASVSVSRPSEDYTAKEVPFGFVDVDEFEGLGSISALMVGGGGQCLIFAGPKLHHSKKIIKKDGVEFCFTGWDLQVGASVGGGYWSRQPYYTPEGRAAYHARQVQQQLDEPMTPKL